MRLKKNSSLLALVAVTFFVYADVVCENVLALINDQLSHIKATVLLLSFLVLQVFFAAIQSGLSDFFGRKKSLITSLGISFFSLILIVLYLSFFQTSIFLLVSALVLKAVFGNTIPISFASIPDTQDRNLRGGFALASSSYSLAFLTLVSINVFFTTNFPHILISLIILAVSIVAIVFLFVDPVDKTAHLPEDLAREARKRSLSLYWKLGVREINLLIEELKKDLTGFSLSAYLLWEVSMYTIIISQVELSPNESQQTTLFMMLGYLVGVSLLKLKFFAKISDAKMLLSGYLLSFLSLLAFVPLIVFTRNMNVVLTVCFAVHSVGNAFLSPTVLSILTKNRSRHDQGKILGLVESVDTIAFLLATVFVMLHAAKGWPLVFLILFSFVSFSMSWIMFPKIRKLERELSENSTLP